VNEAKIAEKHDMKILHYSLAFRKVADEDRKGHFRRLADVKYRILFKKPRELKKILIGRTSVEFKGNRLLLDRTFPSGRPLSQDASRSETKIQRLILRSLEMKYMTFYTICPPHFIVQSNRGESAGPGVRLLRFPLIETMDKTENFTWRTEIRAGPKTADLKKDGVP